MKKNNPGHRKKAIRSYKKTRRRHRKEREAKRRYDIKIQKKAEKQKDEDRNHRQIAEPEKIKLRGPVCIWYECKGCGYESDRPRPPCPKCGHLVFEKIEQPVEFARRFAEEEQESKKKQECKVA